MVYTGFGFLWHRLLPRSVHSSSFMATVKSVAVYPELASGSQSVHRSELLEHWSDRPGLTIIFQPEGSRGGKNYLA
jgi:hypothetical protein